MNRYTYLLSMLALLMSCTNMDAYNDDAIGIGTYLVSSAVKEQLKTGDNRGHPRIVRVGDGLIGKLTEIRPNLNDICRSRLANDIKDSEATHVIKLECDEKPVLAIRLKYEKSINAFHILGWWTTGL